MLLRAAAAPPNAAANTRRRCRLPISRCRRRARAALPSPHASPAREVQHARFAKVSAEKPMRTNAEADGELLETVAAPDAPERQLLTRAAEHLKLSARRYRAARCPHPRRHGRARRRRACTRRRGAELPAGRASRDLK